MGVKKDISIVVSGVAPSDIPEGHLWDGKEVPEGFVMAGRTGRSFEIQEGTGGRRIFRTRAPDIDTPLSTRRRIPRKRDMGDML